MTSLNISKLTKIVVDLLDEDGDDYNIFVESGTLEAETTINLQQYFDKVHTVELSEKYYNLSKEKINELGIENVSIHFGDTIDILPQLLSSLSNEDKCIFFLDGHWSSGDTAKGRKDCPLIEECKSIDSLYLSEKGIIIIDDYRLFGTNINEDWTDINFDSIKECFNNFKIVDHCLYDDKLTLYISK